MSTNIPGLCAAGDIAGLPYQYIMTAEQDIICSYLSCDKSEKELIEKW